MEGSEKIAYLLKDLAIQIPSLLTILGCMIFAVVRWKHHGKVALMVLVGLLLLLIHVIVFAFIYTWVPDAIINAADPANRASVTRNVFIGLAVVYNAFEAVAVALLVFGIFMRRSPQPHAAI
jgi:hypothetical protein